MSSKVTKLSDVKKRTTSSAKYGGKKYMVNKETGEAEEVQVISHEKVMDVDFHKIWVTHLALALDIVGNVKTKVLSYLLKNANPSNNMVIKTQKEIAKELDVSRVSVNQTIKILEDAEILRKKTGVIIINPDIFAKGSAMKRLKILHEYEKLETNEEIE